MKVVGRLVRLEKQAAAMTATEITKTHCPQCGGPVEKLDRDEYRRRLAPLSEEELMRQHFRLLHAKRAVWCRACGEFVGVGRWAEDETADSCRRRDELE